MESLSDRRWVSKFTFFYKIVKWNPHQFLLDYLKENNNSVKNTRSAKQIKLNTSTPKSEKFEKSFFTFCISEWSKLLNLTKQPENI